MSDLPLIAAILCGGSPQGPVSSKVDYYLTVLEELEKQVKERNNPSMRDIIARLPEQD